MATIAVVVKVVLITWLDTFQHQWRGMCRAVEANRIYFGGAAHVQVAKQVWSKSFLLHFGLPVSLVFLFGLRAGICLLSFWKFPSWTDSSTKRFWLGTEILPRKGRPNMEMAFFLWSLMYTLCVLVSITKSVARFKFVALLVVDAEANIKPPDLQLDSMLFGKFAKYRSRLLLLLRLIIVNITYCGLVALIVLCLVGGRFARNSLASVFWIVIVTVWTACVASVVYGIPILISIVVYYIGLKQTAIVGRLEKLVRLQSRWALHRRASIAWQCLFQRFVAANRSFVRLSGELADYNHIWSWYLSICLNLYSMLIVYLTYLIFLSNLSEYLVAIYTMVLVAHLITLTLLLRSVSVFRNDQRLSRLFLGFQRNTFPMTSANVQLSLKTELAAQAAAITSNSFRTLDDKRINSMFNLDVFINMTMFFFLLFG